MSCKAWSRRENENAQEEIKEGDGPLFDHFVNVHI